MKKAVTKLKKKHRDYIWRDEEHDLWYWDAIKHQWCVIIPDIEGGFYVSNQWNPEHYSHFDRIYCSVFTKEAEI